MNYLIGHLIGDYLLQNDWMAQGKKKSALPCFVHVVIYTAAVMLLTHWPLWAATVVAMPHYAIDRWQFVPWYMRKIGQAKFMMLPTVESHNLTGLAGERIHRVEYKVGLGPWSVIVVDNVMHLVCLFATESLIRYMG
jgi:hypothetical protein